MQRLFPNIWNLKKNRLDIAKFQRLLQAAWEAIDQGDINRLIGSMERRLQAVKRARGWYTKY